MEGTSSGKKTLIQILHMAAAWTPNTHLFPTHGFKHLLELDTELLDVVHQDAGLRGKGRDWSQHQQK